MSADAGKLVYKKSGSDAGKLAYKKSGSDAGKLIYKANLGGRTKVTFAWGSDGKDLDICAFWDAAPSLKVGYGYQSGGEHSSGAYHISYSGDIRGVDTSEWVEIEQRPWSGGPTTFTVYLNFFGYDAERYPASTCAVIAAQENGETKVLYDVPCGTTHGSKATSGHGGVRLHFDSSGFLERMTTV